MSFFPQFLKSIKTKKLLSAIVLASIVIVLLFGYFFIKNKISDNAIIIFLFAFAIVQILVLQYFFKNQLKNDVVKRNLKNRIDELKLNLEEANKLVDYKSVYLSNMSYEIRTPLSTVIGMLNMLKQTELDADQNAQVEIAEYSSKHLLQLVNMVTNNTDVESGNVALHVLAIDLKADLSHLFKIFEYQAWEKGLQFQYKFLES